MADTSPYARIAPEANRPELSHVPCRAAPQAARSAARSEPKASEVNKVEIVTA
jgi:hypothetical protein